MNLMIFPDVNVFLHIYLVKLFWGLTFQNIHMLMDVTESLTRERERGKKVCVRVWKRHGQHTIKVEKSMCVLCKHITHASSTTEARWGDSVWLFGTKRGRPLARGQEGSDKQGREVERDVWRKCRHGEERVYVCHREIPWRSWWDYMGGRSSDKVCAR